MFYIIESQEQLSHLAALGREGGYAEVITSNDYYHHVLAGTVAIYVRPLQHDTGYIIPINHTEGLNVDKSIVQQVLSRYTTLYVFNKKNFLYHFSHGNIKFLV